MSVSEPTVWKPPRAISVLLPEIASRIAAGEVVERPASVVKELVENALDAGATQISVILEDGGKQLIQVSDNGAGMGAEELWIAVQRHATSKICTADDLFSISTYGFRGEALPSIASVSEFEILTRREQDTSAARILIKGGIVTDEGAASAPAGTTVRVARLFENTPARLKFLKSSQTELQRSLDFVQRLALARPDVAFSVRHATQESFVHPGGDDVTALVSVFGRHIARELIPISVEATLRVRAYLAPPTRTRPNRTQQFIFVNGRPIGSRTLSHAVDEAYHGLLPHGRFPIAVVLIDIAPDLVDVNVHPRKAEVKFVREHEAHSVVFHALRDGLVAQGLVPRIAPAPVGVQAQQHAPRFEFEAGPAALSTSADRAAVSIYAPAESAAAPAPTAESAAVSEETVPFLDQRLDVGTIRILGQIANTYIVAETREGMAIIDQHVAHERVLYERFRRRSTENPVQMLAVPVSLELSRREALVMMERLKELRELGFVLEEFGPDTVLMRGAPAGIPPARLEPTLRDIASELVELAVEKKMLSPREAVVTSAACKAAVKAGDKMSEPEIRSLLEQLMECENPYVCPHGRPIIVKLDHLSLEKIFQR
ncbi:MAG: DNA mismatch repair endonuclease MutL [Armatimonadetes bacterium]|nr:DNA mismatch repair endonuclease MutL [Armatimonadota bacterium]